MTATVARAFDTIAETYDQRFTASRVGSAQRQAVWRVIDLVFLSGSRILEINCGTGVDAAHLAARGVDVHACDISHTMVDVARRRLRGVKRVELEQRSTEDIGGITGPYDGLLSNFGGINCVANFPSTLAQFKHLVRIGGSVILCYMGPLCAWEVLWHVAHGQFGKAFRRLNRSGATARMGAGHEFRVHYPRVRTIVRALAPEFRLVERKGVGVFVPPSYAESWAADHPRALDFAIRLDRMLASSPVLRCFGDHALLHFRKVCE